MPDQTQTPASKEYTVRDPQDGHTVTFRWHDATPPTDNDLDEIFRESRARSAPRDYSGALDTALGVMGRSVGVPGVGGGGLLGSAAARYVGNPENAPAIGAMLAAPFTAGASIPATAGVAGLAAGGGSIAKNAAEYFLNAKNRAASLGDAAKDVAKDAATQAALTAGFGMLGETAKWVAKKGYGYVALSPAKPLAEEFGRDKLAQAGLELGAVPGTQRAIDQAAAARGASAGAVNSMITEANKTAAPITASEIVDAATSPAYAELRKRASIGKDVSGDLSYVAGRARQLARTLTTGTPGQPALPGGGVDMVVGQARKQAAEAASQAAYARAQSGLPINDVEDLIDKGVASAYKTALETRAPGIDAANARTQTLIGLTDALKDAQSRPVVLRAIAALPTHGTSLLTLPQAAGAATIGLDRAGRAMTNPLTPAMIRSALLNLLGTDTGTEPPPQP